MLGAVLISKVLVPQEGALQPVIGLLSSKCTESQREAALLLGQFATTTDDYKAKIVQRGAVPPLIAMLGQGDTQVRGGGCIVCHSWSYILGCKMLCKRVLSLPSPAHVTLASCAASGDGSLCAGPPRAERRQPGRHCAGDTTLKCCNTSLVLSIC